MKFINNLIKFYENAGHNNLFFTALPAIYGIILGLNIFTFNLCYAILIFLACIMIQLCAQILDDYLDWIFSMTLKRLELEQTGIRGLYTKCNYFAENKKLPKLYFYAAILLFLIALSIFIYVSLISKNYRILLFLIPLPLFLLINYSPKFNKILKLFGTEFLCASLCSFLTMICVFYASTNCIIISTVYIALIFFFFTLNIMYTASLLNLKCDILAQKITLPVILKNENLIFLFSILFTLTPFILLPLGVYLNILPKISLILEALIFHSFWFLYLIYLYIKEPQKVIKWHFLMGNNENGIKNAHNNIEWYTIRCNFIKNIYFAFSFILICLLLNWKNIFIL